MRVFTVLTGQFMICGDFLAGMTQMIGKLEHQALLGRQPLKRGAQPFAPLGRAPGLLDSRRPPPPIVAPCAGVHARAPQGS